MSLCHMIVIRNCQHRFHIPELVKTDKVVLEMKCAAREDFLSLIHFICSVQGTHTTHSLNHFMKLNPS
jgi:hypothetical protein